MFKEESLNQKSSLKDGISLIAGLKTKLSVNNTVTKTDGLDECIIAMISNIDELENIKFEIHY